MKTGTTQQTATLLLVQNQQITGDYVSIVKSKVTAVRGSWGLSDTEDALGETHYCYVMLDSGAELCVAGKLGRVQDYLGLLED
jgi:hypothetical protein